MARGIRMTRRIGVMAIALASIGACSTSSSTDDAAESTTTTDQVTTSALTPVGTESTTLPNAPATTTGDGGPGWTFSSTDVSGDDSLWTGERCGTQIVEGTWIMTHDMVDDVLGNGTSTITIEADANGGGTYELYSFINSTSGSLVEGRAGGTVQWELFDDGNVEFNLTNTEILVTYLDGAEVDLGGKKLSEYEPMLWTTGTC